jgi:hypothetical protein
MVNKIMNYLDDADFGEKMICLGAMFLGIVFFITVFIDIALLFQG